MSKLSGKNTRKKILKETGKLFSKRGYFGVSMQDIAMEVGISKSALYYHFDSKYDLAKILIRQSVDQLKIEILKSVKKSHTPTDVLFDVIKTMLDYTSKHPELSLLTSLGFSSDKRVPIIKFIVDIQIELTKFIRDIVSGIDFARKFTFKSLKILTSSLVSFVLNPVQYTAKNTKQLASDFTELLMTDVFEKPKKS